MKDFIHKYFKGDLGIWLILLLLIVFSVMVMASASSSLVKGVNSNYMYQMLRHGTFLMFGAGLAWGLHIMPFRWVRVLGYLLLPLSVILLLVLFFAPSVAAGVDTVGNSFFNIVYANEAARWLTLFGITFQPSELAKIALIICMADLLSIDREKSLLLSIITYFRNKKGDWEMTEKYAENTKFAVVFLLLLLFVGLIYKENISTAVLILIVGCSMIFIANVSLRRLFAVLGIGALVVLFYIVPTLKKEVKNFEAAVEKNIEYKVSNNPFGGNRGVTGVKRIVHWLHENDSNKYQIYRKVNSENTEFYDGKKQVIFSQVAIARGGEGFFGLGPGNSFERDYLYQPYSDFIFAIVLEEYGFFIGGVVLIGLYMWFLIRAGRLAYRSRYRFPALLVMGLALMLVVQAFISMEVAVHLGPVTGQTLPLISRGGTSVMVTCIYFGIIQCVARNINETNEVESNKKVENGELIEESEEVDS